MRQNGTMPTADVIHDADRTCYQLVRDGVEIGVADYRLLGDPGDPSGVVEFHHTVVDPTERGQGYAARLVQASLDDVRTRGLRVKASCWYVDQFIAEHPDYADLRA